jgi:hypothetical protein
MFSGTGAPQSLVGWTNGTQHFQSGQMVQPMPTSNEMPVFVQHPSQCMYSTYQTVLQSEPSLFISNGQQQSASHRLSEVHLISQDNSVSGFAQPQQFRCEQVCNMQYQTQYTPPTRVAQTASAAPPLRQRMSIQPPSLQTNFSESARERERAAPPPPPAPSPPPPPEPEIKYVDRFVEVPVEKIVLKEIPVEVEKICWKEVPVQVDKVDHTRNVPAASIERIRILARKPAPPHSIPKHLLLLTAASRPVRRSSTRTARWRSRKSSSASCTSRYPSKGLSKRLSTSKCPSRGSSSRRCPSRSSRSLSRRPPPWSPSRRPEPPPATPPPARRPPHLAARHLPMAEQLRATAPQCICPQLLYHAARRKLEGGGLPGP